MTEPIRVMIAEDSPVTSRALEELLSDVAEEFKLVGMAADAIAAVDLARTTRPDVALLDVRMPGGGGPVATDGIRSVSPRTQILAYSVADDRETVLAMLRSGAHGYVLKGTGSAELLDGLRACAAGRTAISPGLSPVLVEEVTEQARHHVERARENRYVEDRIRELLAPGGTVPAYQPIVDLRTGALAGFEALARFGDGRPPDEVFAEAHSLGLGIELELHAAKIEVDVFRRGGGDRLGGYLAINASAGLLTSSHMVDLIRPHRGERRVLELTEQLDGDAAALRMAAVAARSCGLKLAIDDAGTGFSGLRRVVELSPDILKLDRSLVTGLERDRSKRALVAALARYCQEMEYLSVAEGIEHDAELEVLRSLGVTHGQGYLLGMPGPLPPA